MLRVSGLGYSRNDLPLFDQLDFTLAAGEILHIVGANGSGKTSLLNHLIGLTRPQEGTIHWNNTDIFTMANDFSSQLAFVGHKQGLKAALSVEENIYLAAQLVAAPSSFDANIVLTELGLDAKKNTLCRNLSAGQKQRLALARLLIMPKLLWVLDEPFTAIDQCGVELLIHLLQQQLDRQGLVILTSHQTFSLAGKTIKQLILGRGNEDVSPLF